MTLRSLPVLAVFGGLAVAAGARADEEAAPAIRDEAGLFTPGGVQQAEEDVRGIRDIYHIPIVVQTVEAPPDDVKKQLQGAKNNAEKAQILRDWAERRAADDAGKDVVYILVCKDVVRGWFGWRKYGCVVVTAPPETLARAFTAADAKALQDRLTWFNMGQNKEKNDRLLLTALAQIRGELAYNLRPAFPWAAVGGVIAGVLVVWAVLAVVRLRLRAAGAAEPQRLDLFHALLGGMFGGAAGHWIYDTLFVAASREAAPPVEAQPAPEPPAAAPPEPQPEPAELTKAERLDLAAHDQLPDDEPSAPAPTRL